MPDVALATAPKALLISGIGTNGAVFQRQRSADSASSIFHKQKINEGNITLKSFFFGF